MTDAQHTEAIMRASIMPNQTYTAVIQESEGWWIGWIEEIPGVNAQESSREALIDSLRQCLLEAIDLNRHEARAAAGPHFLEEAIAI